MTAVNIVLLAGGKSLRMGRDKLALPFQGSSLTERCVKRFQAEFGVENVVLSVNDLSRFAELNIRKIADEHAAIGPIGGLYAALTQMVGAVFLVASDMPFCDPAVAKRLLDLSRVTDCDACALQNGEGKPEPLFAYYAQSALPTIRTHIADGEFKMGYLLKRLNTRFVSFEELGGVASPQMLFNINTPEDYSAAADAAKCQIPKFEL
jgi:molybdopterin-guanine dinucleotide biosynthesis protein A